MCVWVSVRVHVCECVYVWVQCACVHVCMCVIVLPLSSFPPPPPSPLRIPLHLPYTRPWFVLFYKPGRRWLQQWQWPPPRLWSPEELLCRLSPQSVNLELEARARIERYACAHNIDIMLYMKVLVWCCIVLLSPSQIVRLTSSPLHQWFELLSYGYQSSLPFMVNNSRELSHGPKKTSTLHIILYSPPRPPPSAPHNGHLYNWMQGGPFWGVRGVEQVEW